MSLRDDLSMYYTNTWMTRRSEKDGMIYPHYILGIDVKDDARGTEISDFTAIADVYNKDGERNRTRISLDKLELSRYPDIGYTLFEGLEEPVWLAYSPARRSSKGITQHRLSLQGAEFSGRNLFNAFNSKFDGRINNNLCVYNSRILYKGRVIGKVLKKSISLNPVFDYLKEEIDNGIKAA